MAISFFFENTQVALAERRRLKAFIQKIFQSHGKTLGSLAYVFCTDEYLLEVNRKFLDHDYYTDIITFDLSEKRKVIDGEIYVSVDRVKDNASQLGVSVKEELHRVIFHGALHLCGLKDKTKLEKTKMTIKENRCLKKYFN